MIQYLYVIENRIFHASCFFVKFSTENVFFQTTKASTLGSSSAYNFIDSVPPMQLLADTGKSSEEDDDDIDITEAELNALPLNELDGDSDQDIDIEDENEGVNNDFLRKNRLSAFLLFAKKTKPRLIESNPGLDSGSLNLQLRELWSTLPNSERAIWKRKTSKIDIFPSQLQQRLDMNQLYSFI